MHTNLATNQRLRTARSLSEAFRVLVVEDEVKLATLLTEYLKGAGYDVEISADGNDAIVRFRHRPHDLVLLDLMLPGRSGLEVCRELRACSDVPIIMITALVEEADRLLGLDLGADDYICKPFSPREVVARARAILRRSSKESILAPVPGLRIDETRMAIEVHGVPLDFTAIEFRLLRTLASVPGRVFSRQRLLNDLYSDHRVVADRTIDTHIRNLRRKLEVALPDQKLIQSIYGAGYKLVPLSPSERSREL